MAPGSGATLRRNEGNMRVPRVSISILLVCCLAAALLGGALSIMFGSFTIILALVFFAGVVLVDAVRHGSGTTIE